MFSCIFCFEELRQNEEFATCGRHQVHYQCLSLYAHSNTLNASSEENCPICQSYFSKNYLEKKTSVLSDLDRFLEEPHNHALQKCALETVTRHPYWASEKANDIMFVALKNGCKEIPMKILEFECDNENIFRKQLISAALQYGTEEVLQEILSNNITTFRFRDDPEGVSWSEVKNNLLESGRFKQYRILLHDLPDDLFVDGCLAMLNYRPQTAISGLQIIGVFMEMCASRHRLKIMRESFESVFTAMAAADCYWAVDILINWDLSFRPLCFGNKAIEIAAIHGAKRIFY
jgi:hypothetical protein